MDITELILDDHREQRRLFAYLDEIEDAEALAAVWGRLRNLLESHARAEEELFYPRLLEIGTGGGDADSVEDEVVDVIKDHNEIRDACAEVDREDVGSTAWRAAVVKAREANSDHMAEEEREDLADFRHHADLATRHEIGVAFAAFMASHLDGVRAADQDPASYVESGGAVGAAG